MKRGVVLLNLGGPWTIDDVKPFLYRLFSDPAILVGLPTPLRQAVAFFISQVKGPSSIEMYRKIGGGSPQLQWTRVQAEHLLAELARVDVETRVVVGMRAAEPSIEAALRELREWGADELVLIPLFPQYSTTTSGSCLGEARRVLKALGWCPSVREVASFCAHPEYIALLREAIDEAVGLAVADGGSLHVLLSAHSLPLKIVDRGDSYPDEVNKTVAALTQGLTHPWSLAFQSRNGPMPWIQPYTEDEIRRLAQTGVRRLVVVPISFVSDHIETLYEIDQLYAGHARAHGIDGYYRARVFNGDPRFARVLASLAGL